jgi:hypothetical protein
MTRFMLRLRKSRHPEIAVPQHAGAAPPPAEFDFDAVLPQLRAVWVRVPCAGCGGAHEMTCAELLSRQLLRGASWPSEECDEGAQLAALLSPQEVVACGGDVDAIGATLRRRGVLCAPQPLGTEIATPGHEPQHMLLAH